jgi:hypothetical protein
VVLLLLVIGVDYALMWGLLAFLLHFVPNIGNWVEPRIMGRGLGLSTLIRPGKDAFFRRLVEIGGNQCSPFWFLSHRDAERDF